MAHLTLNPCLMPMLVPESHTATHISTHTATHCNMLQRERSAFFLCDAPDIDPLADTHVGATPTSHFTAALFFNFWHDIRRSTPASGRVVENIAHLFAKQGEKIATRWSGQKRNTAYVIVNMMWRGKKGGNEARVVENIAHLFARERAK